MKSSMKLFPNNSTEIDFTTNTHDNYSAIIIMSIIQIAIIILLIVYRIDRRRAIPEHNIDYYLQTIIYR
jgi:hypothetical protein